MGLLDLMNSDAGMVLAAGLLDAGAAKPVRTGTMQGIAQSLLGAQQYKQAQEDRALKLKQQQAQEQMQAMQLQQLQAALEQQKRQQAQDAEFRNLIPSPQMAASSAAMSGGGGPTVANAQRIQPVDPAAQLQYEAMRLGQIKPMDYINSQRKDTTPMKLGAGEALIDPRTYKPLFTNPKEDTTPSAIKEYQFAVNQGYKGTYEQWDRERKRAGATNVSVNTAQNPFYQGLGKFGADQFQASTTAAQEAAKRIEQNGTIQQILGSGKVYTGTGAEAKLAIGKALQSAGVNIDPDAVRNTELLGTQLAQRTLNSIRASGLGAGNGFTNADREFLQQAVGGSIQLTGRTLARLVDLDSRAARAQITKHNKMVEPVQKAAAMQGFPMDFSVPEPQAGGGGQWSITPVGR